MLKKIQLINKKINWYFFQAFRRIFNFRLRSSRAEFWILTIALQSVDKITERLIEHYYNLTTSEILAQRGFMGAALMIFSILIYLMPISNSVRRLHDINLSGWWMLYLTAG